VSEPARGLQGAELEQALDHDETRRIAEACSATELKAFDVELVVACHVATLRNRLHDGMNMLQAIKVTIREAVIEARADR
jgi:predicted metal-dependent phosphoesterase TrpH